MNYNIQPFFMSTSLSPNSENNISCDNAETIENSCNKTFKQKNHNKTIHIESCINNYINTEEQIQDNSFTLSKIKSIRNGGFAQIDLVIDDKTKKKYAFKRYLLEKASPCKRHTLEKAFSSELQFFKQVDSHPNIVKYFGTASLKGNLGLVLSYIDGFDFNYLTDTLSDKYINNKLSHSNFWGTIQYLFYYILLAVAHIHKYDFAHQDIKPSNIIFDKESLSPIIIDFNTSNKCGEVLSPGKVEYASPEYFTSNGRAKISKITDSYSIGQLLYQIYFSIVNPEATNTFLAGTQTGDLISHDVEIKMLRMRSSFREYVKINNEGKYQKAIKALSHEKILELKCSNSSSSEGIKLSDNLEEQNNNYKEKLVGYYHEGYQLSVVNFINECMHPNPDLRLTVYNALQHPFITDRIVSVDKVKELLKLVCSEMLLRDKINITI